jgi:hypothetical protein
MCGRTLVPVTRYEEYADLATPIVASNVDVYQFLLLEQLASIRAALFWYSPPYNFAAEYLLGRLFKFIPFSLAMPVAPMRDF